MPELKPCPFCGSDNVGISTIEDRSHYGDCWACEAEGPWKATVAEAIEAWNTRVTTSERPQFKDDPARFFLEACAGKVLKAFENGLAKPDMGLLIQAWNRAEAAKRHGAFHQWEMPMPELEDSKESIATTPPVASETRQRDGVGSKAGTTRSEGGK